MEQEQVDNAKKGKGRRRGGTGWDAGKGKEGGGSAGKGKGKSSKKDGSAAGIFAGTPFEREICDVIASSQLRHSDFDQKGVALLSELQGRGKISEAMDVLKGSFDGREREQISNWRAYTYTLLRKVDGEAYSSVKGTSGRATTGGGVQSGQPPSQLASANVCGDKAEPCSPSGLRILSPGWSSSPAAVDGGDGGGNNPFFPTSPSRVSVSVGGSPAKVNLFTAIASATNTPGALMGTLSPSTGSLQMRAEAPSFTPGYVWQDPRQPAAVRFDSAAQVGDAASPRRDSHEVPEFGARLIEDKTPRPREDGFLGCVECCVRAR